MNEKMFYENISKQMQEDKEKIKRLEDNWNELKEELIKELKSQRKLALPVSTYCVSVIDILLHKINCLELEKGDSNE